MTAVFGVQGFVTALRYRAFRTLTGGDDWFGFESRARDILEHGLLMTQAGHWAKGRHISTPVLFIFSGRGATPSRVNRCFGPIFANFLVLAVTALVVGALVTRAFGRRAGAAGVVTLALLPD